MRHYFGLHVCDSPHLPRMGTQHACEEQTYARSCPWNGLRVSAELAFGTFRADTDEMFSASIAVTVRLAYVMDFKNPDFLYATVDVAIWSDIEQGLAITAGSLATLRPLYRQVAKSIGISTGTPEGDSRPSGMRTPQWSPQISSSRKQFPSLKSLLRSEKGTVRDREEEYGMGDLQPVRLRDDLVDQKITEKNDKGFTTWTIKAGKTSDEECRAGEITMQTDLHQASERRR